MAWSTREIADLAGTSLRAVRHYHQVGLLAEPERRANGYKQYGVAHLVRLLRIKRLTDLGFSLPQIAELGDFDDEPQQQEAVRTLDAELAATVERLQQARADLAQLLRGPVAVDLPPEVAEAAARRGFNAADRSIVVVTSLLLGAKGLEDYTTFLREYVGDDEVDEEFAVLPPDADESTIADLAARMAVHVAALVERHPALLKLWVEAPRGERSAQNTFAQALRDVYHPAQLEVMRRVSRALQASRR